RSPPPSAARLRKCQFRCLVPRRGESPGSPAHPPGSTARTRSIENFAVPGPSKKVATHPHAFSLTSTNLPDEPSDTRSVLASSVAAILCDSAGNSAAPLPAAASPGETAPHNRGFGSPEREQTSAPKVSSN